MENRISMIARGETDLHSEGLWFSENEGEDFATSYCNAIADNWIDVKTKHTVLFLKSLIKLDYAPKKKLMDALYDYDADYFYFATEFDFTERPKEINGIEAIKYYISEGWSVSNVVSRLIKNNVEIAYTLFDEFAENDEVIAAILISDIPDEAYCRFIIANRILFLVKIKRTGKKLKYEVYKKMYECLHKDEIPLNIWQPCEIFDDDEERIIFYINNILINDFYGYLNCIINLPNVFHLLDFVNKEKFYRNYVFLMNRDTEKIKKLSFIKKMGLCDFKIYSSGDVRNIIDLVDNGLLDNMVPCVDLLSYPYEAVLVDYFSKKNDVVFHFNELLALSDYSEKKLIELFEKMERILTSTNKEISVVDLSNAKYFYMKHLTNMINTKIFVNCDYLKHKTFYFLGQNNDKCNDIEIIYDESFFIKSIKFDGKSIQLLEKTSIFADYQNNDDIMTLKKGKSLLE